MTKKEAMRSSAALSKFVTEVAGGFGRVGRPAWGERYMRGLLLDGQRKSIEPLSQRLRELDGGDADYVQGLQQFINQSPWDWVPLRENLLRLALREIPGEPYVVIDDTGFLKQGEHSVGVHRQYTGSAGKITNCQIGVSLLVGTESQSCPVDMALYLPETWTADRTRMKNAGVPPEVEFKTKPELALQMVERAAELGALGTVLADAAYGDNTDFRQALHDTGRHYCVGVSSGMKVIDAGVEFGRVPSRGPVGRPPTRPSRLRNKELRGESLTQWAKDRATEFKSITWRRGTKGPMRSHFAAWRIRPAHGLSRGHVPPSECWLLVEWPAGEEKPSKYFLSNLPTATSLRALVRAAKARWIIEQQYRELKDELGLDHFEGRSWNGWHHHVTMTMLAYGFLTLRVRRSKKTAELSPNFEPRFSASCS